MVKAAEKSERTFLSLNESKRREEKQQDDAWRLELENTLRAATGKVVAKTLDELEELQEAEADALDGNTTPATEAKEADQEVVIGDGEMQDAEEIAVSDDIEEIGEDPMLRETGRIVNDLIDLLNGDSPRLTPSQPMTAKTTPKKPIPAG